VLLPTNISPEPVFDALSSSFCANSFESVTTDISIKAALPSKLLFDMVKNTSEVVYCFKATCAELSDETLYIEIEARSSLDMLHEYISCLIGFLPDFVEYAFVAGEADTPFNTYSPGSPSKSLDTQFTTLTSLPLEIDNVLLYAIYGLDVISNFVLYDETCTFEFELTLTKKTKARYGRVYPWQKTL